MDKNVLNEDAQGLANNAGLFDCFLQIHRPMFDKRLLKRIVYKPKAPTGSLEQMGTDNDEDDHDGLDRREC